MKKISWLDQSWLSLTDILFKFVSIKLLRKDQDVLETVYGNKKAYLIKKSVHGFYAEVRPISLWEFTKEQVSDSMGLTYIHPQYFSNFYSASIESMRWKLMIHIKLENIEK